MKGKSKHLIWVVVMTICIALDGHIAIGSFEKGRYFLCAGSIVAASICILALGLNLKSLGVFGDDTL